MNLCPRLPTTSDLFNSLFRSPPSASLACEAVGVGVGLYLERPRLHRARSEYDP